MIRSVFLVEIISFIVVAFLVLQVKFHENYPEQSPEITIIDSGNVDDQSTFETEIQKIV
jgi:hypothetical protein